MRYAHFAEVCEKCGTKRNMWQSHILIKLTCLAFACSHAHCKLTTLLFFLRFNWHTIMKSDAAVVTYFDCKDFEMYIFYQQ